MLIALLALNACSVGKLGRDLDRAADSYAYLKLRLPAQDEFGGEFLVALYLEEPEGRQLQIVRTPNPGEVAVILVPQARYTLVVFEDLNGDFVFQQGEPAQVLLDPILNTSDDFTSSENLVDQMVAEDLQLIAGTRIGFPVDLSLQSLKRQLQRIETNFLAVVDWDDPRFSPERVSQGLWQPLTFAEEVGFGLYLTEPLDLTKEHLLFVHGINGAPLEFRVLAEALQDRYQAIYFHYPSGFPLEQTSHILQVTTNEVLKRYPDLRLSLVAHSMGGLVARRALVTASDETTAKLDAFVTMSTPWQGHEAAALGVAWSPAVAPVWRGMVPGSEFLGNTFARPLPQDLPHYLFFTYSRETGGPSRGDDGVVTVKSQLDSRAQLAATASYGVADNHMGILGNACTLQLVRIVLDRATGVQGQVSVPQECSAQ